MRIRHRMAMSLVVALVVALVPVAAPASAVTAAVTPPAVILRSVDMLDASTVVAAASNGTIWRSVNSGSTWTQVRAADAYDFRAVDFWDVSTGLAVDLAGKVARTTNGGVTWSNINFSPYADMDGITAAKNHHGLACLSGTTLAISVGGDADMSDDSWVGAVAMRTTGALEYWQNPLFQAKPHWFDVTGLGDFQYVGEGEFFDVSFADSTRGWAVGRDLFYPAAPEPLVYRTTDGGGGWTRLTSFSAPVSPTAVAFSTASAGVVAGTLFSDGAPRVYRTTDGGATWTQGTLPAGVGAPRALHMTSATAGWLVGDGGTLLRTTNGGATWTACTKPAGFTANLYDVKLVGTKGVAVGVGAVLTTTDGINWTGAGVSVGTVEFVGIAGADRIGTALEASKKAYASAPAVVIATAWNWPDALGGAALAGAVGGPILLTNADALPAAVLDEIGRLGATKAYILGGPNAVQPGVETALKSRLGTNNVIRLGGADRYETARMVAERTVSIIKQSGAYSGTAFVATGANFPDALGASPLAAAGGWPIYLVRPTGAEDALVTSMKAVGVKSAIILGGPAAVPAAVETDLRGRVPGTYLRIAGADRYETALKVADYGVTSAGLSWDNVAIATGANFPDALAGGPLQARVKSVMLLTPPTALHGGVRSTLVAHRPEIATVRFLGGLGAVSQVVRDEVAAALK